MDTLPPMLVTLALSPTSARVSELETSTPMVPATVGDAPAEPDREASTFSSFSSLTASTTTLFSARISAASPTVASVLFSATITATVPPAAAPVDAPPSDVDRSVRSERFFALTDKSPVAWIFAPSPTLASTSLPATMTLMPPPSAAAPFAPEIAPAATVTASTSRFASAETVTSWALRI